MATVKTNIEKLNSNDIYSLMLFALFKMRDIKEYSTLSELVYVLDKSSLMKFLECFGGLTITVPTKGELQILINALLLYQLVDIEGKDFNETIETLDVKTFAKKDIEIIYFKLKEILGSYDFNRE